MADVFDTQAIENLVRGLLRPLTTAVDSPAHATQLLIDLGYLPPASAPALGDLAPSLSALADGLGDLHAALEADDDSALAVSLSTLFVNLGRFFAAMPAAVSTIENAFAGTGFAAATNLAADLPARLVDYMVVRFLEDEHPTLQWALVLLGAITNEDVDDAPTAYHAPHRSRVVHWDLFKTVFADPRAALNSVIWSNNSLRYLPVLGILGELGTSLGLPTGYASPKFALLAALNSGTDLTVRDDYDRLIALDFPLYRDPAASVGLELYPIVDAATGDVEGMGISVGLGVTVKIPLSDAYQMELEASVAATDAFGVKVRRGAPVSFVSSLFGANPSTVAAGIQFGASVAVEPTDADPTRPLVQFGAGGSRLEIGAGALKLGIERSARDRFFVEGALRQGKILISSGESDGFLSTILPPDGIQANFDLGIGFATDTGLYFSGSGGLEIQLPLHIELGPLEIMALDIALKFGAQGIPVELGATIKGNLGPLKAVVESVGVKATFAFPPGGGNLGPADLTFGFKPPKGVGLAIDAGVIKGGGYLYLDYDKGEYAGALELVFSNWINLKAIGLISTKMPDGTPGFSLLVIITAEFGAGLQLGYGFKLTGVGGLLGLNRTVVLETLAAGVQTGAVTEIMFPTDIIANAPRIISDLRAIFPPKLNRFLIGPLAKLGWGTPTLITLSLGVVIEIPGNIAILGVLQLILPDLKSPVIVLQVAFMGGIEFDKKRLFFFASIFDSRVLFITLEGDMGVLAAFGDEPAFVVTVGGFHPRFNPPPLPFPNPRRLSLCILNQSWGRIRVETYFAITSNSVQFGASAELFFGFNSLSIEGHFAFDALMRFVPFYFTIAISASVSLKVFGAGVFSIGLNLSLEGPTPWRVQGTATVHILFFDVTASIDSTWGDIVTALLEAVAVVPLLVKEYEKLENWKATLAPGNTLLVSLAALPVDATVLVLHPLGSLQITQRAVPLDISIDKVGTQRPSDANHITLRHKSITFAKKGDTREQFASAQFQDMSDAEKLSRPSFEPMNGGLELSVAGDQLLSSRLVKRVVRYDQVIIDSNYKRLATRFVHYIGSLFAHFLNGNAAALSSLSQHYQIQIQPNPAKIQLIPESYAVVFTKDNKAISANAAGFGSQTEAMEYLYTQAANDPTAAAGMQVIPAHERNAA